MSQCKEFQGKTLDDAIQEACDYYGVARAQLEIEIVSDAKTGIFGLVGVKKACIRASRVQLTDTVSALLKEDGKAVADEETKRTQNNGKKQEKKPASPRENNSREQGGKNGDSRKPATPAPAAEENEEPGDSAGNGNRKGDDERPHNSNGGRGGRKPAEGNGRERGGNRRPEARNSVAAVDVVAPAPDEAREDLPDYDLAGCDQDELFRIVQEVVLRLVEPIVGTVPCREEIHGKRVRVTLDCGDAAGLLVGREGQTLASVQYLAARIVSRRLGGSVRLQIDAGNYRERQDDKLKDLALHLAAKVKETGRPQSTRPLSAYQRRVVHLALEGDETLLTRSKGEGLQRRVVILLKKGKPPSADMDDADAPVFDAAAATAGESAGPSGSDTPSGHDAGDAS